jgi:protein Mpv17
MVKLSIAFGFTAAAISGANAFVAPPSLPAYSSSKFVMRADGSSKSGNPFGSNGKFSIIKFFTGNPSKGFNGSNGNNGMDGGNNGNNGFSNMNIFGDEENDDNSLVTFAAMGFIGSLWSSYEDALEENPILVKACTSLIGFSVGDFLAQKFVSKSPEFDYYRLARMASFGFLFHGTISHFFYNKLEDVIPGTTTIPIIKKVFTDQVLWAPIFTFVYLTWMGVTSGLSPAAVGEKIKTDLIKGVVGSWSVWPLVHAIGFKFVPLRQRLLYINCIQIGYNVFLSMLGSNSKSDEPLVTQGIKK